MIQVKRVYEAPAANDGTRFLVDHLWPRGLKKEAVRVKAWLKDVSPSNALRQWFGHKPAKWKEFQRRYAAELDQKPQSWQPLLEAAREGDITLLYGARDTEHNNALALQRYLEQRLKRRAPRRARTLAAA
jgi:uncharacterized protein YeaO (DUF488 family)